MELEKIRSFAEKVKGNIQKVIVGKEETIDMILVALIADGHVLLEDVPGTGKTMLAKALALSLNCQFKRIQFTPDLLPSDVTGMNIFNQKEFEFQFKPGPIFSNIILADEINRATPRTQSSLLESMEEKQVTVDGETRKLSKPFLVIATQNPIEIQGTFPLPEAQLDRFFIKLKMGYPTTEEALGILDRFIENNPIESLQPVVSAEEILDMQRSFNKVYVSPGIRSYIISIVEKTRTADQVVLGVSPRGSLALLRACQAYAAINGRDYVLPDDVKKLVKPVLSHRVMIKNAYGAKGNRSDSFLDTLLNQVPVPTESIKAERE